PWLRSFIIEGACAASRYEPDLSLNLEICEMINKKQGNTPREAAMAIVRMVNSRHLNVSMLALTLLDNCVKNCGYPFHLQIATKEFLNELVRKFPERPAPFPNPVTQRILSMIKEWKIALADMSRHKDDLVHIKDMYRLLRFKGYRFPDTREASVAALAPSQSLKSPEELEAEDRIAQSAKLQELIRRGRPQDLVEANHLMKIMSGYDQRQKPNYKQQAAEELHRIQDKVILLNEMLLSLKPGEKPDKDDTITELKNSCINAQPKIQKFVTEEEDSESIERLLTLNDMINNVTAKYADLRKGIYDTHYEVNGTQPQQTNSTEPPKQAISLIDFDDEMPSHGTSTPQNKPSSNTNSSANLMDELDGLFGPSSTTSTPAASSTSQNADLFDLVSPMGSMSMNAPPKIPHQHIAVSPNPPSRASPAPTSLLPDSSFGSPKTSATAAIPKAVSPQPDASANTENFAPITFLEKNGLRIVFQPSYSNGTTHYEALFSNTSTAPMDQLMFQLAAPKSMQLKMDPQSSQAIPARSVDSVRQKVHIKNPNQDPVKLKYKVTYAQHGVDMEQTGQWSSHA
ncbi:hypothetical protein INT44_000028, partial [Umbelopsis vinacea]